MTITDRTTATKGVPMDSLRKTALVAGVFYVITFVSIPTLALYGAVHDPNYMVGPGPDTPVVLGGVLEIIVALAGIGTAVVLLPRGKETGRSTRAGLRRHAGTGSRRHLRRRREPADRSNPAAGRSRSNGLVAGQALVAFYDRIFVLGQSLMPVMNALLLGSLLYQSRLVPRILPLVGLIGAALLLASDVATLFGLWDRMSPLSGLLAIPIALWEFSLGVYLIVKGFKPSPITAGMTALNNQPTL
jgi:Domain of unknown function (DUF4386)